MRNVLILLIASISAAIALGVWLGRPDAPRVPAAEGRAPASLSRIDPKVAGGFAAYIGAAPVPEKKALLGDRLESPSSSAISAHYAGLRQGELLRAWVTLGLDGTDSDLVPERSRKKLLERLKEDPARSSEDLATAIGRIPVESREEWLEAMRLASVLAADPAAKPIVGALLEEESRRPGGATDERVAALMREYFALEPDWEKRTRFYEQASSAQRTPEERAEWKRRYEIQVAEFLDGQKATCDE